MGLPYMPTLTPQTTTTDRQSYGSPMECLGACGVWVQSAVSSKVLNSESFVTLSVVASLQFDDRHRGVWEVLGDTSVGLRQGVPTGSLNELGPFGPPTQRNGGIWRQGRHGFGHGGTTHGAGALTWLMFRIDLLVSDSIHPLSRSFPSHPMKVYHQTQEPISHTISVYHRSLLEVSVLTSPSFLEVPERGVFQDYRIWKVLVQRCSLLEHHSMAASHSPAPNLRAMLSLSLPSLPY